jgi:hypothetical protein
LLLVFLWFCLPVFLRVCDGNGSGKQEQHCRT